MDNFCPSKVSDLVEIEIRYFQRTVLNCVPIFISTFIWEKLEQKGRRQLVLLYLQIINQGENGEKCPVR